MHIYPIGKPSKHNHVYNVICLIWSHLQVTITTAESAPPELLARMGITANMIPTVQSCRMSVPMVICPYSVVVTWLASRHLTTTDVEDRDMKAPSKMPWVRAAPMTKAKSADTPTNRRASARPPGSNQSKIQRGQRYPLPAERLHHKKIVSSSAARKKQHTRW